MGDASRTVHGAVVRGDNVLFEGAQGVLLDLDHGTYPFVTSSSTTAGGACAGLGIGPTKIDTVSASPRDTPPASGDGPFPTELTEATGELLRKRGHEFGSVTGRPRRCGWLDIPAVRLAVRLSGIESLALTKLDVLAGLDRVKLCVGYRLGGRTLDEMPVDLDDLAAAEPMFEELDGWPEVASGSSRDGRSRRRRPLRRPGQRAGGHSGLGDLLGGRPLPDRVSRNPFDQPERAAWSQPSREICVLNAFGFRWETGAAWLARGHGTQYNGALFQVLLPDLAQLASLRPDPPESRR